MAPLVIESPQEWTAEDRVALAAFLGSAAGKKLLGHLFFGLYSAALSPVDTDSAEADRGRVRGMNNMLAAIVRFGSLDADTDAAN